MSKTVFYLKDCDNPEFYDSDKPEVIRWILRWTGQCGPQISYSVDLHLLVEKYYFEN